MTRTILTFETTHHALWAEEVAREAGIAHEVIAAPPEANAKCNIALEIFADDEPALAAELAAVRLPFDIYRGRKSSGGEE